MTRVLVDSDSLVYAAGFASQSVVYDWSYVKDGSIVEEGITPDKSYLGFLEVERPMGVEFSYTPIIEAQPLVNALAMVKKILLSIEEAVAAEEIEFKRLELFLTGSGNHRDKIATLNGYKANRIGVEKPVHYLAIRRYLVERWKAEVINGMEADDILGIIAASEGYNPDRVLIISLDKDLKTIPGRLYNFRKKRFEHITEGQALAYFYKQVLTGDSTDNYKGCYKCGPKKADELILPEMTEQQMYDAALGEYEQSLSRKGCPYLEMGAQAALLENAQLAHLLRFPGEMWRPPTARGSSVQLDAFSGAVQATKQPAIVSGFPKQGVGVAIAAGSPSFESPLTSPTSTSGKPRSSKPKAASTPLTEKD